MSRDEEQQTDLCTIVQTFVERARIIEVTEPIKSGKEASVYRCAAHPSTGLEHLALKVYRRREDRSFKNDALYREGSLIFRVGGGNTRAARALRAGSRFGREVQAATWTGHEWEVLRLLHGAGLPVPAPVDATEGAILLELFADEEGLVAAPLARARFGRAEAAALFDALCADVARMLALHVVHGDLSPFNVLWSGRGYRIIDLPQAVDPRFNPNAFLLLQRDIESLGRFCARFGEVADPADVAREMWGRFERGEIG